jgi:hypothetical protein
MGLNFIGDNIFIGLEQNIFKTIIISKLNNTSGYIRYPEQLTSRLKKGTTNANYVPQMRPFFDYLLRDAEDKKDKNGKIIRVNKIIRPTAHIMASIGYERAFKDRENFILNKTHIQKFINKAIPAINKITLHGKIIENWELKKENSIITLSK